MARLTGVAYARYSSDKQQESSIVVQLTAIRRFCEMHDIELIHEYVDEAQTGTNANRKEFQEMIRDAEDREFRFVIVHRMDRWARCCWTTSSPRTPKTAPCPPNPSQ